MVLCSNYFQFVGIPDSPMTPQDEEYLFKNVIDASLGPGDVWFDSPEAMPMEDVEYDEWTHGLGLS